jgi:hypothetical protein
MTIQRVERWLLGAALVAAGMASGGLARAAGQAAEGDKPGASGAAGAQVTVGGSSSGATVTAGAGATESTGGAQKDKAAEEKKKEEDEPIFAIGVDAVFGSAVTDHISQTPNPNNTGSPSTVGPSTPSRVTTQSFVFGAEWEITHDIAVGARLPLVSGEISDPNFSHRGSLGLGNLEFEGSGNVNLSKGLDLELTLGVAVPTASGSDSTAVLTSSIDQAALDRFAINRATAMARGYEEDALYTPKYWGIIPKVKLKWGEHEKWHVDPWIKLENLIGDQNFNGYVGMGGQAHQQYIGELVFGANAGFFVNKYFEPALRIWANAPLANADFTSTVAVVEPQLKFHVGDFSPMVGGILPIAGTALTSPYAGGVRVALAGRF